MPTIWSFMLIIVSYCFLNQSECHLLEQKEVICTSDKIIVNLAFIEPFNGIVFVDQNFANEKCRWRGTGGHYLLVVMPLENATTTAATGLYDNNGFCGLRYNPDKAEHSLTLVISPDRVVLTDETFALNVKCVHSTKDLLLTLAAPSMDPIKITNIESLTVFGSGGNSPQLDMQIIEGHGLFGKFTKEAKVGQRLTIDITLKDTSIYDLFVHNCFAHDGSYAPDASINITDSNGCAVSLPRAIDAPVFVSAPQKNSTKHVYVYIYGFQFTSSEYVNFECRVTACIYECSKKQCNDNLTISSPQMNSLHKGEEMASTKIQAVLKILPRKSALKRHAKKNAVKPSLPNFQAKPPQS